MYKKLSILTLLILILTITVSFAWMMELGGQRGHYVEFDYDKSIYIS